MFWDIEMGVNDISLKGDKPFSQKVKVYFGRIMKYIYIIFKVG